MHLRLSAIVIVLALGLSVLSASAAIPAPRVMFSWDTTNGFVTRFPVTHVSQVNNLGQVVGWDDLQRGFIWEQSNGLSLLPVGPGVTTPSHPSHINDGGIVIGQGDTLGGEHGFTWDSTNGTTALPIPAGASSSRPTSISNNGLIVGDYQHTTNGLSAMTISGPTVTDITGPGPGAAWDTNNAGQIVGRGVTGSGTPGFYYSQATGWTDLGFAAALPALNITRLYGWSINESGQIWGSYQTPTALNTYFFYDPINGFIDTGITAARLGHSDINNNALAVGYFDGAQGLHGFVWDANNGMTDIGLVFRTLTVGPFIAKLSINDAGFVVGATDIPEPASLALITCGALLLLRRVR